MLVQAKPSAKKWRHTEIHHYDKLSELFARDRATGEGAVSVKENVQQWKKIVALINLWMLIICMM